MSEEIDKIGFDNCLECSYYGIDNKVKLCSKCQKYWELKQENIELLSILNKATKIEFEYGNAFILNNTNNWRLFFCGAIPGGHEYLIFNSPLEAIRELRKLREKR